MTERAFTGFGPKQLGTMLAPPLAIASAGLAARTPIAAAYPSIALLLFMWIASDALLLALMARAPRSRPSLRAVFGAMAAACVAVALGSPPVLRDALLAMPALALAMAAIVSGHVLWGVARAGGILRSREDGAKVRWIAAASEIFPPPVVRLAAAELSLIHIALFRWGGPPDAPANSRAFSYHKHLAPICAALLALQGIEIGVYHILVGHWSRTAAIVMFVLSDVGLIYMIGLIKSFRFRPVLITPEGVQVRAGLLIDRLIPFGNIARLETHFSGETVRSSTTLNAALLAWPNIVIRLHTPMPRRAILGRRPPFDAIAFRLDEPESFARLLAWRLGQSAL